MMNIIFKPLEESDLELMCNWLNQPHLQDWWREGELSVAAVREKYLPRIQQKDSAVPYLAYLHEVPTGYIQYYGVAEGSKEWWPDQPGPGVYGIDLFIADSVQLNKGIGTAMVSQFVQWLIMEFNATEIRIDPRPDNERAIRCYEKAGFTKQGLILTPDGPAMMMTYHPRS